jgi:hypothetical protein
MNFTRDMLEKVLDGTKTQTRRPRKDRESGWWCDWPAEILMVKDTNGRAKWIKYQTYAVCPGRGKKAVARIEITDIRCERACDITLEDAWAEGFENREEFFGKLRSLYGAKVDLNQRYWVLSFKLV